MVSNEDEGLQEKEGAAAYKHFEECVYIHSVAGVLLSICRE